jgi:cytochrome c553
MRIFSFPAVHGLVLLLASGIASAAAPHTGEQIYKQRCAVCHGAAGEGSEDYPHSLVGNRSAPQLARLIARTMPKDSKEKCVGEDARKVSAYIHDAFYSKAAQERKKTPRLELSRLTVRQYKNAVADLVGSFRTAGQWDQRRGLRGEYFKSRALWNNKERVLDRIDPGVQFDFGVSAPGPKDFDDRQFSIRWQGSVLAPETGEYEFIVRTEHAARLWLNDLKRPLIDAWVKSGTDIEHRGSIFLLGGRAYPLRLEFSKAKQGVDDSKNKKGKRPAVKASIALAWRVPHRAAEVIPTRNLCPNVVPELLVVTTPFPADDRSVGYERGTAVSKAWDQANTEAALEVAAYVAARLPELTGIRDDAPDRRSRLRAFCLRFAERAFRRPLTDEQKRLYVERRLEGARNLETAVKRAVLLVLKSPRFLYREVGGEKGSSTRDAYDVASRISFTLWDSIPDKELLDAAA